MDVMMLEIIISNLILRAYGPDISQGSLGRFLHHIAHLSGQLKLAFSRHHIDLDLQGIAPHAGPGQAADDPDLILLIGVLKGDLLFA